MQMLQKLQVLVINVIKYSDSIRFFGKPYIMEIMDTLFTLIGTFIIFGGAFALYKYHIPPVILSGGILIIVYLGFVYDKYSTGKTFIQSIYNYPIIGIIGLVILIIGIIIKFKK